MTDPMLEPMTGAQFEQTFNFSINMLSNQDLKGYFKTHSHHSPEILRLSTHIKYNPAIVREVYMSGDYEVVKRLLSLSNLPDELVVHRENIMNYIFSIQMLKIYNDDNVNTPETTQHYLETGQQKQKQMTIAYRRHYHEQTKRCKGSVTRSLTAIKTDDSLWNLFDNCCVKEDNWLRRRHIAVFRAGVVKYFKNPKAERPKKITMCELVIFNRNYRRHLSSFG